LISKASSPSGCAAERGVSARPSWPTLSDSLIRSTRTRFSVHTGQECVRSCPKRTRLVSSSRHPKTCTKADIDHGASALSRRVSSAVSARTQFRNVAIFGRFDTASVSRHQAFVDRIAPAARNIHAYWLARRAPRERLRQLNKASAPGRNDPCSCGSGKKFKHCHGAPNVTLH
jgi:SEC-C motif